MLYQTSNIILICITRTINNIVIYCSVEKHYFLYSTTGYPPTLHSPQIIIIVLLNQYVSTFKLNSTPVRLISFLNKQSYFGVVKCKVLDSLYSFNNEKYDSLSKRPNKNIFLRVDKFECNTEKQKTKKKGLSIAVLMK